MMSRDIWSRLSFLLNPLVTMMLAQPLGPETSMLWLLSALSFHELVVAEGGLVACIQ